MLAKSRVQIEYWTKQIKEKENWLKLIHPFDLIYRHCPWVCLFTKGSCLPCKKNATSACSEIWLRNIVRNSSSSLRLGLRASECHPKRSWRGGGGESQSRTAKLGDALIQILWNIINICYTVSGAHKHKIYSPHTTTTTNRNICILQGVTPSVPACEYLYVLCAKLRRSTKGLI